MNKVKVSTLAKKMELENLTTDLDLDASFITVPDINRPSLQ
ncbi:MAG: HPr(Ser) kinase/phosphatase, partial [Lachnospiraceae bacterium]|nr:HPr(Ser) kinase/phosphatase [Lachnospiraceae bacterium]